MAKLDKSNTEKKKTIAFKTEVKTNPKETRHWKTEYFTLNKAGALSGMNTFFKHARPREGKRKRRKNKTSHFNTRNKSRAANFLKQQEAYTLHFPVKRRFYRRPIVVRGPFEQFQADLIDLASLKKQNKGYKFLLTVIDSFSKKGFAKPLKQKNGAALVKAFQEILNENQENPKSLLTDKGTEFLNQTFQKFLRTQGIKHVTSENAAIKGAIVERWNRTLKKKIFRYFTYANTRQYLKALPDILKSYNSTYHRSIKTQPRLVSHANAPQIFLNLYSAAMIKQFNAKTPNEYRFQIGDRVRISQSQRVFEKGYLPRWSREIFTIHKRMRTFPHVYKIRDDNGEIILGSFYPEELQKVIDPQVYQIEKVIRRRGNQALVKWLHYPETANSWVSLKDIRKI